MEGPYRHQTHTKPTKQSLWISPPPPHTHTAPYVAEYINTFALTAAACVALVTSRLAAPGVYIKHLHPPHAHQPQFQPPTSQQAGAAVRPPATHTSFTTFHL